MVKSSRSDNSQVGECLVLKLIYKRTPLPSPLLPLFSVLCRTMGTLQLRLWSSSSLRDLKSRSTPHSSKLLADSTKNFNPRKIYDPHSNPISLFFFFFSPDVMAVCIYFMQKNMGDVTMVTYVSWQLRILQSHGL